MIKKPFVALMFLTSASFAIDLGALEISPEVGVAVGQTQVGSPVDSKPMNYGVYGRVWLGTLGFVVTPQVKANYISKKDHQESLGNLQYGAAIGSNFGFVAFSLTPYIGANLSSFSKAYDNTIAYNAGIKFKPAILPFAASVEYTYQNPDIKNTNAQAKMHNVQLMLGLHF